VTRKETLSREHVDLKPGDALVAVDVQNDFFSGGSLTVPGAEEIIPAMNHYIDIFQSKGLPVYVTRDWHPEGHCSFKAQGGPWPVHCVAGSKGAQFHPDLHFPDSTVVISTATELDKEAYSGFEGTDMDDQLRAAGIRRLLIGGLATDYCVLNTVKDALRYGYKVFLLADAIRAVNVKPEDGQNSIAEMTRMGAIPIVFNMICG
jgi:nicotinamidase/pyrazinamidase